MQAIIKGTALASSNCCLMVSVMVERARSIGNSMMETVVISIYTGGTILTAYIAVHCMLQISILSPCCLEVYCSKMHFVIVVKSIANSMTEAMIGNGVYTGGILTAYIVDSALHAAKKYFATPLQLSAN